MMDGVIAKIGNFLSRVYVERQFYVRSRGQVQFMSFSPLTQIVFSVFAVMFFGWVAYTSVNVVFKEQIIAAKERRFVRMQAAYEERLAEMQSAYEELNGTLVLAQERFIAVTSELESKHRQLEELMGHHQVVSKQMKDMRIRLAHTANADVNRRVASGNKVMMRMAELDGAPRQSRMGGSPLDRRVDTVVRSFDDAARAELASRNGPFGRSAFAHEAEVEGLSERLTQLKLAQRNMINDLEEATETGIQELEEIVRMTGIDPYEFMDVIGANRNLVGGPFIAWNGANEELAGGDQATTEFSRQLYRVATNIDQLSNLQTVAAYLPLASPVDEYRITSGYGPRRDPFRKRMAFHAGLDMAGAYRSPVMATAPGIVTFAGRNGPYGKMIEIDHGNGIVTRYGHLHSIKVKKGDRVAFRDTIGLLGSTGRSTGPHVHYEMRTNKETRDPAGFIEAGRYVFKSQR